MLDKEMREKLREKFHGLVRNFFRSGLDPASIINRKKFSRQCALALGIEKADVDADSLIALGKEQCIEEEGKFFAISLDAKNYFEELFVNLHASGDTVIFYRTMFARHEQDLFGLGIISMSLLEKFLRQNFSFHWRHYYFVLNSDKSPVEEMKQRMRDRLYLNEQDLEELFPYLPTKVSSGIAEKHLNYTRLKNGDLLLKEATSFEPSEWEREKAKILKAVKTDGYFFLSQLELPESRAYFADWPENVFKEVLNFRLKELGLKNWGQMIYPEGNSITLSKLIEGFCKNSQSFNFETLELQFGADIFKLRHLTDTLQNSVIQINKDEFVHKDLLEFDAEIDEALSKHNQGIPFPVLSFKYFSLLPEISGYEWNSYLLQSYIIHKSKRFCLIRPAPNNECIGIIYDKHKFIKPDYYKLTALNAKHYKIPPDPEKLTAYIRENGFFARIRKSTVANILKFMDQGK